MVYLPSFHLNFTDEGIDIIKLQNLFPINDSEKNTFKLRNVNLENTMKLFSYIHHIKQFDLLSQFYIKIDLISILKNQNDINNFEETFKNAKLTTLCIELLNQSSKNYLLDNK